MKFRHAGSKERDHQESHSRRPLQRGKTRGEKKREGKFFTRNKEKDRGTAALKKGEGGTLSENRKR